MMALKTSISKQQTLTQAPQNANRSQRIHTCNVINGKSYATETTSSISWGKRAALTAAMVAVSVSLAGPHTTALAAEVTTDTTTTIEAAAEQQVEPIYFGNGCYWGRQYDFISTEKSSLKRSVQDLSAVVGYAGGRVPSPSNKVCYYYTPEKDTVYEHLGHAEVVKVDLKGDSTSQEEQFREFAKTYFKQFRKLPDGRMIRQDPQDAGPGYRNVVGIPGGITSPLFNILQEENTQKMVLLEGQGNEYTAAGKPTEGDQINTVWVLDSKALPFYQAEKYHQFHNGLGKEFPADYKSLKQALIEDGKLKDTGCPEYFFMGS